MLSPLPGSNSSMSGADADVDDYGLREACGLFGCVSLSAGVDVAHIVHLGLVGVQHR